MVMYFFLQVIIRKLEKNSDISFERYFDLKAQDLGEMVKIPKMGKTLYKYFSDYVIRYCML